MLHPALAATLGRERFQREIRATARLQHPRILPVLDSGDAAGQLWYAMPYVLSVPSLVSVPSPRVDHTWDALRPTRGSSGW